MKNKPSGQKMFHDKPEQPGNFAGYKIGKRHGYRNGLMEARYLVCDMLVYLNKTLGIKAEVPNAGMSKAWKIRQRVVKG